MNSWAPACDDSSCLSAQQRRLDCKDPEQGHRTSEVELTCAFEYGKIEYEYANSQKDDINDLTEAKKVGATPHNRRAGYDRMGFPA